jgi:hypothetical protein
MLSRPKLKSLGVELLDRADRHLRCLTCGQDWYCHRGPRIGPRYIPYHTHLSRGYWKCPNGCNSHGNQTQSPGNPS